MSNEYLDLLRTQVGEDWIYVKYKGDETWSEQFAVVAYEDPENMRGFKPGLDRRTLVSKYSWAIPDDNTVEILAACGPLVEMGAGTGYWAKLLHDFGADIDAYDANPPQLGREANHWHPNTQQWFQVRKGGVEVLSRYRDRRLFLCWPPYSDPFAAQCLEAYEGDGVAFIGEDYGGCCADDAFFQILCKGWQKITEHAIPQYHGMHDTLTVWERR